MHLQQLSEIAISSPPVDGEVPHALAVHVDKHAEVALPGGGRHAGGLTLAHLQLEGVKTAVHAPLQHPYQTQCTGSGLLG